MCVSQGIEQGGVQRCVTANPNPLEEDGPTSVISPEWSRPAGVWACSGVGGA
jgi:hypothetical protein